MTDIDIEAIRGRLNRAGDREFLAPDVRILLAEVERLRGEHDARDIAAHASLWEREKIQAERDRLRTELDEVGQRSADRMVENHRLTDAIDAVRALADGPETRILFTDIRAALDEHLGAD